MSDTDHPNAEDYRNRAERAEQALAEMAGWDGLSLAVALTQCQAKLATERANADRLAEALGEVVSVADRRTVEFDAALQALAAHNLLRIDG